MLGRGADTANNVGVRAPSIQQQQKLSVDVEYGDNE